VRTFFKMFFAALLALIVFCAVALLIIFAVFGSMLSREKSVIASKSVLVIDLSRSYKEKKIENPFIEFTGDVDADIPTLYELVRLIGKAKSDSAVKGLYIKCNENANGFAASEELRNAILDFKKSNKFVYAFGDYITQKAYYVSNVSDRIYCNPKGMVDWRGFAVEYMFFKNLLKKLEIEPQVFYDGKYKSATEPFREEKMTAANRLQTEVWLGDLYKRFLSATAEVRRIDTTSLHDYANRYLVETPADAVKYNLIDAVKYDDEVRDEIKKRLGISADEKINFITPGKYLDAVTLHPYKKDKIAVIYAEGEIVTGKGEDGQISADEYRALIRKVRYNKDVKAVVLRVNSPGGSSLASEIIWRELEMTQKEGKPVVISMGDVAASGGYYIACGADSIFAQPNTITGSIGVFAIMPNMQNFFKNKLGVTFDGVKTATYADALTITRPLTEQEKKIIQKEIDLIYSDFKARVAEGRKKDSAFIDSVAQGRVWTGERAMHLGLVDKLGNINDAINCAAGLAKLKEYTLREYPEPQSIFDLIMGSYKNVHKAGIIKEEMGEETYQLYKRIKRIKESMGKVQALMPYDFTIE
jgi:protease IV